MKIVIDIPEEVYKSIQDNDYCGISNADMYNAAKNGTPLDKIREEIEQITDSMGVSYNQYISKIDVLRIIDHYKAESEEQNET